MIPTVLRSRAVWLKRAVEQLNHSLGVCTETGESPMETGMEVATLFPHCDPRVLHKPGECEFCDQTPGWQDLRESWNINFTGHYEPQKMLCPSEQDRGIGRVGREGQWHGNAPSVGRLPDAEEIHEAIEGLQNLAKELGHDS